MRGGGPREGGKPAGSVRPSGPVGRLAPARAALHHLRQQGGAPAPPTRPAKSRARSGRHSAGPAGGPALPDELGPVSGWPGWVIGAGAMPAPRIPTEDRCGGWPVPHSNPPWGPERRQKYIPPPPISTQPSLPTHIINKFITINSSMSRAGLDPMAGPGRPAPSRPPVTSVEDADLVVTGHHR